MKRLFQFYEVLGPLVAIPLATAAWVDTAGNWAVATVAVVAPIIHAYIIPVIGAGYLKMWRINSPLAPHGFRWHHGFVFGSATAVLTAGIHVALSAVLHPNMIVAMALATGCVLLAVNWIYDTYALRAGVLEVFNAPWAKGESAWRIAGDYSIWFFGLFGVIYGAGIGLATSLFDAGTSPTNVVMFIAALALSCVTLTVVGYVASSYVRHGHHGCRPLARINQERAMA
jgi:hypothetical protein